jgi:O-antigen ligase
MSDSLSHNQRAGADALPRAKLSALGATMIIGATVWLILCYVFFTILAPSSTPVGLAFRIGFSVVPVGLIWLFHCAARSSRGAIVTLFVLTLVLADISIRQRALTDTSLDAQNLVKLAVWGLAFIVAIIHWRHLREVLRQGPVAWAATFAVWCMMTAIYSPVPAFSFGAGFALLSVVLHGAVVRQTVSDAILVKTAIISVGLLLCLSLVLFIVAPDRAQAPMEGGTILRLAVPFGSPNSLGRAAALVILLCVLGAAAGLLKLKSIVFGLLSVVAILCLALSQSRTAAIALICAIGFVIAVQRPTRFHWMATISILGVLVASMLDLRLADLASIFSRTGRTTELATLTGRTDIWNFFWDQIWSEPVLGYGFGSTKALMPALYRTPMGWTTTHAHNMWIQVWFTTGLIGFTLLCGLLISQFRYCFRSRDILSLGFLVFGLVLGVAEPSLIAAGAPSLLTTAWALWLAGRNNPVGATESARRRIPWKLEIPKSSD